MVLLSYYFLAPESIRWLVAKRRYSEASALIEATATANGTDKDKAKAVMVEVVRQNEMEAGS